MATTFGVWVWHLQYKECGFLKGPFEGTLDEATSWAKKVSEEQGWDHGELYEITPTGVGVDADERA